MPKVSIIVPIYNVEKYLSRCMDSLLNQTLTDIEIIMVDDESPDNCPAMCDEYAKQDSRIKVIHKKNGGLGFARNSGLEIATGEFVAFVDSDDFVDVTMYETLYRTAKESDLDTVYCGCNFYKDETSITPRREIDKLTLFQGRTEVDTFLLDMVGPEPSYPHNVKYLMSVWRAIYSMDLIKKENVKFCSEREFASEDLVYHIDYLARAENVGFVPNYFYYYCYNGSSLSKSYSAEKYHSIVRFLSEVERKLAHIFEYQKYKNNYKRLAYFYFYGILKKEINLAESQQKNIRGVLKRIFQDSFWENVFMDYPYQKLPLKQMVVYFCCKYKMIRTIPIVIYLAKKMSLKV